MGTTGKIILGTVQLGLNYGINNSTGKPAEQEAFDILDIARGKGIFLLDTAEAYGNAIEIIGNYHQRSSYKFQVISKFRFFPGIDIEHHVRNSLEILHVNQLHAYLLHDPGHLDEKEIEGQFRQLKEKDLIKYSGVSIYTNRQFEKAIAAVYIDIIQIPYNLLDNIHLRGDLIKKAKDSNKMIHARSVFLQGLFFMDQNKTPLKLLPLKRYIKEIDELCKEYKVAKATLALKYVLNNDMIDAVLMGVDKADQLLNNINSITTHMPDALIEKINLIKVEETDLLNPSNWN